MEVDTTKHFLNKALCSLANSEDLEDQAMCSAISFLSMARDAGQVQEVLGTLRLIANKQFIFVRETQFSLN